jgi:hypothetical protein
MELSSMENAQAQIERRRRKLIKLLKTLIFIHLPFPRLFIVQYSSTLFYYTISIFLFSRQTFIFTTTTRKSRLFQPAILSSFFLAILPCLTCNLFLFFPCKTLLSVLFPHSWKRENLNWVTEKGKLSYFPPLEWTELAFQIKATYTSLQKNSKYAVFRSIFSTIFRNYSGHSPGNV